jgi:hypothetical protein
MEADHAVVVIAKQVLQLGSKGSSRLVRQLTEVRERRRAAW